MDDTEALNFDMDVPNNFMFFDEYDYGAALDSAKKQISSLMERLKQSIQSEIATTKSYVAAKVELDNSKLCISNLMDKLVKSNNDQAEDMRNMKNTLKQVEELRRDNEILSREANTNFAAAEQIEAENASMKAFIEQLQIRQTELKEKLEKFEKVAGNVNDHLVFMDFREKYGNLTRGIKYTLSKTTDMEPALKARDMLKELVKKGKVLPTFLQYRTYNADDTKELSLFTVCKICKKRGKLEQNLDYHDNSDWSDEGNVDDSEDVLVGNAHMESFEKGVSVQLIESNECFETDAVAVKKVSRSSREGASFTKACKKDSENSEKDFELYDTDTVKKDFKCAKKAESSEKASERSRKTRESPKKAATCGRSNGDIRISVKIKKFDEQVSKNDGSDSEDLVEGFSDYEISKNSEKSEKLVTGSSEMIDAPKEVVISKKCRERENRMETSLLRDEECVSKDIQDEGNSESENVSKLNRMVAEFSPTKGMNSEDFGKDRKEIGSSDEDVLSKWKRHLELKAKGPRDSHVSEKIEAFIRSETTLLRNTYSRNDFWTDEEFLKEIFDKEDWKKVLRITDGESLESNETKNDKRDANLTKRRKKKKKRKENKMDGKVVMMKKLIDFAKEVYSQGDQPLKNDRPFKKRRRSAFAIEKEVVLGQNRVKCSEWDAETHSAKKRKIWKKEDDVENEKCNKDDEATSIRSRNLNSVPDSSNRGDFDLGKSAVYAPVSKFSAYSPYFPLKTENSCGFQPIEMDWEPRKMSRPRRLSLECIAKTSDVATVSESLPHSSDVVVKETVPKQVPECTSKLTQASKSIPKSFDATEMSATSSRPAYEDDVQSTVPKSSHAPLSSTIPSYVPIIPNPIPKPSYVPMMPLLWKPPPSSPRDDLVIDSDIGDEITEESCDDYDEKIEECDGGGDDKKPDIPAQLGFYSERPAAPVDAADSTDIFDVTWLKMKEGKAPELSPLYVKGHGGRRCWCRDPIWAKSETYKGYRFGGQYKRKIRKTTTAAAIKRCDKDVRDVLKRGEGGQGFLLTLEEVLPQFQRHEGGAIAAKIVEIISSLEDNEEDTDVYWKRLADFALACAKLNRTFRWRLKEAVHQFLFFRNSRCGDNAKSISTVRIVSKFYANFLFKSKDNETAILFIYDAVCFLKYKCFPILHSMLSQWQSIFFRGNSFDCLVTRVMAFMIMNQKMNRNKALFKVVEVQEEIQRMFDVQIKQVSPFQWISFLLEDIRDPCFEAAMTLLFKRMAFHWTYCYIIMRFLLPVLVKWKEEECDEIIPLKCVKFFNLLLKAWPAAVKTKYDVDQITRVLLDILSNPKSGSELKEETFCILSQFLEKFQQSCRDTCVAWMAEAADNKYGTFSKDVFLAQLTETASKLKSNKRLLLDDFESWTSWAHEVDILAVQNVE